MKLYTYTQLATRIALALATARPLDPCKGQCARIDMEELWSWKLPLYQLLGAPDAGVSAAASYALDVAGLGLGVALLLGYHIKRASQMTAALWLLSLVCAAYAGIGDAILGSAFFVFFTAAVILSRDRHYPWSLDALLTAGIRSA